MAIELKKSSPAAITISLNPCYNGMAIEQLMDGYFIIFVCLNPCYNGMAIERWRYVS